jgi:hypothetical protein
MRVEYMQVQMAAAAASTLVGNNPLHIALQNLSGPYGSEQLYNAAARGLHLASKDYQAAARATLRELRLDSYYRGLLAAYPDPSSRPAPVPWWLLAACPAASSWVVAIEQLAPLGPDAQQQLLAAASRVKRLKVVKAVWQCVWPWNGLNDRLSAMSRDWPSDEQLRMLGRLLRACNQLAEVEMQFIMKKPWLVLDPNSSSLSTATAPVVPLCSWKSYGVSHELLTTWVEQQQQQQQGQRREQLEQQQNHIGRTLRAADIRRSGPGLLDFSNLWALHSLRELCLRPLGMDPDDLMAVTTLTQVTQLHLAGGLTLAEAACALTGLRQLSLSCVTEVEPGQLPLPSSSSRLKQLTGLQLAGFSQEATLELPSQLVNLERLELLYCYGTIIPATYTRLTHLSYGGCRDFALPSAVTGIQEIIAAGRYAHGISSATRLTRLCMADRPTHGHNPAAGSTLAVLQGLTCLRHLGLDHGCGPEELTVLGGLKRLTHLSLKYTKHMVYSASTVPVPLPTATWSLCEPLPALRELHITGYRQLCSLTAMSHWLVRLTALTSLHVEWCALAGGTGQLCFPPQLQHLHLKCREGQLQQLPCALQQLSALTFLSVHEPGRLLCHLPSWLTLLRRLEALDLYGTGVVTEQPVLALMPSLRCVRVPPTVAAAVVFGQASHLLFVDISRVYPGIALL